MTTTTTTTTTTVKTRHTKARKNAKREKRARQVCICRWWGNGKQTGTRGGGQEEGETDVVISTWNDCRCSSYFKRRVKKLLFLLSLSPSIFPFLYTRCTKRVERVFAPEALFDSYAFPGCASLPPLLHHRVRTGAAKINSERQESVGGGEGRDRERNN